MAYLVQAGNLSDAWLQAMHVLLDESDGKAVNLNVAFATEADAAPAVVTAIDEFLEAHNQRSVDRELLSVETVANTIFPQALYHPSLGDEAAPRLFENYELSMRMHRRRKWDKDTYFNRLMAYPVADVTWNQLEYYVDRLKKQRETLHFSSSYELGLSHPIDAELRVQAPFKDKRMSSFPCLSHISLTLVADWVHMTATYRNQAFIARAYGNYVGLARLLRFIAIETGAQAGEIEVVATHGYAELNLGKQAVSELVESCREALNGAREARANV
jgi:hypothetical protein